MKQFFKIGLYLFFVSAALGAGLFFINFDSASTADERTLFITIDKNELFHVQETARAKQSEFAFDVLSESSGIALLKISDSQLPALSGYMHDEFHKCAGFIFHETLEDAQNSLARLNDDTENLVAVNYTIDNQANVTPLINEAQEPNILQTIQTLSAYPNRRYNQPSGLESANWIKNRWTEIVQGRSDITVEFYNHPTTTSPQPSIIATVTGTEFPNEIIVLGAHQDSIRTGSATGNAPGADDDASGIATITEALRVMVDKNFRPKRTVQFMAYAAEEVGLRGSNAIAAEYRAQNRNVVGVIQLDMTNYQPTGGFDIVIFNDYTNAAQNQFLRDLLIAYFPSYTVGSSSCGYGCSDHAAWHNRQYPASFPHEATMSTSNSAIHTANDTLARSNNTATHALKFTKLSLAYIGELAKGSAPVVNTQTTEFDFDGDGRADTSVYRASEGNWFINQSANGFSASTFGAPTDKIVPADYDGDGKTDVAVYRAGVWYIMKSASGFTGVQFGAPDDIPVPADFDGDGKADVAVFRAGVWYVLGSQTGFTAYNFGAAGDKPFAADFDGDDKADYAVFRDGIWYMQNSSEGFKAVQFGLGTDIPVPADYDGDGKTDVAVFRDGNWFILKSTGGFTGIQFGLSTDIPVAADFDGDGKSDIAVFRAGVWYILRSSNGAFYGEAFGNATDKPIPAAFLQ